MLRRIGLILVLALAAVPALRAGTTPFGVGSLLATWHDGTRNRDVPVKIYYPLTDGAPAPGRFPIIVFSHGLGGTREGYGYLGEAWAAHGYISVHVQHLGSDDGAYKNTTRPLRKLRQALADPENSINRPLDIKFAIDQLYILQGDAGFILKDHLDLPHIGVAGHSFGAYTAMAIANQAYAPGLGNAAYPDPRVSAVIAMSTPTPARVKQSGSFAGVKIPVFHMTGTKDEIRMLGAGAGSAADRRIPYDHDTLAPAYLLTLQGGDHMVFSGRGNGATRPDDAAFQQLVVQGSLAFWDGYLKGNADALRFLQAGGFAGAVGPRGVFEEKNLTAAPAHN